MGEVRDRDGTSEGSSPAIMFCLIVAGENTHLRHHSNPPVAARSDSDP